MGGTGPPGSPGESFHPPAAPGDGQLFRGDDGRTRFNLLGWDGRGDAPHLFPDGEPS